MLNISDVNISFQLENLKIKVIRINYGVFFEPFPEHRHGNRFYEAHIVRGGKGSMISEGKEYPLSSGTVYMTGPLITHEQLTDSSDPMDEYCIQFEISEKKGVKEGKAAQLLKDTHFWIGEDSQNMEKFFEMLDAEDAKRELGYIENVTSIVKQILIALVRNYIGSEISYDYSRITPDDKRMVIADESFLYSYASITLEDLSERLNLSSRQTQRFLKKAYGKTFIEMRTERRMEVAQKLMKKGMSASSAASAVGYEDAKSLKMCGK